MRSDDGKIKRNFQRFGLVLAGLFYLASAIFVLFNTSNAKLVDSSVKTITFAHWQLEDGFREGYEEAIRMFEKMKAAKGEKVRVVQTAVPFRGYKQWFMTQLIGGAPADVIELNCGSEQRNQYFTPLSSYIGKPNPFNKDTPFEGVPWKDTFHDNMNSSLDPSYGEYYGVGCLSAVNRIYVNLDLLEKATGSRKFPKTLSEWLKACRKIKEYGKRVNKPLIPIGVRGFDKGTLRYLFNYYFSQMNCDLHDDLSEECRPTAGQDEVLKAYADGKIPKGKLLGTVSAVKEIGDCFGKGFAAMDLEQTKFLFFAGKVAFFPEGTWNAYSMVKNSPFEVGIMEIPVIGRGDPALGRYYVGRPTEQGLGVGGQFGIPKRSKNFKLALEFLQFTTSWKINKMIMADYCKWIPAVKRVEFKGLLKDCEPQVGSGRKAIRPPFAVSLGSRRAIFETLESMIINDERDPEKRFWKTFVELIPDEIDECAENATSVRRSLMSIERRRSAIAVDMLRSDFSAEERERLDTRLELISESVVSARRQLDSYEKLAGQLKRIAGMEK